MKSKFLPTISVDAIHAALTNEDSNVFYDLLVQPLHEELYVRQSFDFLHDLSPGQQLLLAFDYVRMQVGQGGFIQLIENGYVPLLPGLIGQLQLIGATDMAHVLDDALKVYVLNRDLLDSTKTVEQFSKLYEELKEFEGIDERYAALSVATTAQILQYATHHMDEFVAL